jgi:hypothetical protein
MIQTRVFDLNHTHPRRGAADRGEYREVAVAFGAPLSIRIGTQAKIFTSFFVGALGEPPSQKLSQTKSFAFANLV